MVVGARTQFMELKMVSGSFRVKISRPTWWNFHGVTKNSNQVNAYSACGYLRVSDETSLPFFVMTHAVQD